jgi:hypothetical protein
MSKSSTESSTPLAASLSDSDAYLKLYRQYMDLQRILAMLICQEHGGEVTIWNDPSFPRLAWIHTMMGADTMRVAVTKVPG